MQPPPAAGLDRPDARLQVAHLALKALVGVNEVVGPSHSPDSSQVDANSRARRAASPAADRSGTVLGSSIGSAAGVMVPRAVVNPSLKPAARAAARHTLVGFSVRIADQLDGSTGCRFESLTTVAQCACELVVGQRGQEVVPDGVEADGAARVGQFPYIRAPEPGVSSRWSDGFPQRRRHVGALRCGETRDRTGELDQRARPARDRLARVDVR